MESIIVSAESKRYPICFDNSFSSLAEVCEKTGLNKGKAFVISDTNVGQLYIKEVIDNLKTYFDEVHSLIFESGEKSKNLSTIMRFYDVLLENRAERKSVIFALGGGVCGDMAGFAASTYLRGIKFVQIPTSLLSQVDSSVGGKVGVDYRGAKNIVGSFYQPEFVFINTSVLKTLPEREFKAGMAEVIKYAPIASPKFYDFLWDNKEDIKNIDEKAIRNTIRYCCMAKADVVSKDEKEGGLREILNFGHTIGHAIESVKNFELLHGECVAIGMSAAMEISVSRGYITKQEAEIFRELLRFFGLDLTVEGVTAEEVYKQMFLDKKVKDNKLSFVLIKKFGKTIRTNDVTEEEVINAINYVIR